MKAPKMWIGLFWDNDPGAFENPSFLAARLIKKLRKLCENTCDFLKFFFDVFRGQNNLKTPYSNDQCKVFDLLSYCRNSAGLNRSLISRSSIWRLIPLTNLHCLKQVVIWEQLFKQATRKNITRTIWISKKTKWKPSFDYRFSFAWFRLGKNCYLPSTKPTNHPIHPI